MQYTPVIPPLPSPEGQASPPPNPPVIPSFSPHNPPQSPAWMRGAQAHPFASGFPPAMYQQTPYLAVPTLPGQATPNSYYLAPTHLPPAGGGAPPGTPMAPVGPSGFSADWTGFPITATVPPQGTPWQPASHGFPGQGPPPGFQQQAQQGPPPGTGFNMFQQPLPLGAFLHPGYTMAMQTPLMGAGPPQGWPHGAFQGGFPGGPPAAAPPPAAPSHAMPPSRVAERFDQFDKFAEENWCKLLSWNVVQDYHC